MKLTFIDATDNPGLLDYIQTKQFTGKAAVFNLYSLAMVGIPLKNLQPFPDLMPLLSPVNYEGDEITKQFDEKYAYQLSNYAPSRFALALMMEQLQLVDEVILMTNYNHPVVSEIMDSLCKYIQQKYTLQVYIVKDIEDIDPFTSSEFETNEGYQEYLRDVEWMMAERGDITKMINNEKKKKTL